MKGFERIDMGIGLISIWSDLPTGFSFHKLNKNVIMT